MSYIISSKIYDPGPVRQTEALLYFSDRSFPETPWNIGLIRFDLVHVFYLYNGSSTPMQFTGVTYQNASSIEVSVPDVSLFPVTIQPGDLQRIEVSILINGPTTIDARITLNTDLGDSIIYLYGTRAPFLDGSNAYLTDKHNWASGYVEVLKWKTSILYSYDGTEQRIGFLPLPRREYSMEYLETSNRRAILETYLSARVVDYYYVPTWHDLGVTTTATLAGSTEVYVDTKGRDYTEDQNICVWSDEDNYEVGQVLAVFADHVVLLNALNKEYSANSQVAPMRPFYLDSGFSKVSHTDTVSSFKCNLKSVYDSPITTEYIPDTFDGYQVFPLDFNFNSSGDTTKNKWQILDNGLSTPEIIKESIEPINSMSVEVLCLNRAECYLFRQFLYYVRGRAIPFYVKSKSIDLVSINDLVAGAIDLIVEFIDYTNNSFGELAKSKIQIDFVDGTFERYTIINATFNPAFPDREELSISPAFQTSRTVSEIVSIKYLQLVRMNTDEFNLKWEVTDVLRCSFPLLVLQKV